MGGHETKEQQQRRMKFQVLKKYIARWATNVTFLNRARTLSHEHLEQAPPSIHA